MHYYQFNIGDYSKDAKHLSLEEDAIYRRLIDLYYLDEQPIPLEIKTISRKILARNKENLIIDVLEEFFIKTEKGFEHSRIKKEIKKYKNNQKNKSKAAKARWAKVSEDADAMHVHNNCNANHKPLTINQEPLTKEKEKVKKRFASPSIKECYEYCSDEKESNKFWNHYESNGWRVGKNKMVNWKSSLTNWIKRAEEFNNGRSQKNSIEPFKKLEQSTNRAVDYINSI